MKARNIDFSYKLLNYDKLSVEKYLKDLRLVGSLSRLFSDSNIPFLHYRATENLYCDDFGAENLARADVSADAKYKDKGVGIKTFIENAELQKVAEFNNQHKLYEALPPSEMIRKVAELRNLRMGFTMKAYGLTDLIYHCVVRSREGFLLFEEKMNFIDIEHIKLEKESEHTYSFSDGIENYKFDASKSTLYKRFATKNFFADVKVDTLTDPIDALRKISLDKTAPVISFYETVIIPLYATDRVGNKTVNAKSGLNQWNAGGRARDNDEVYIPFNSVLREKYENFFPPRDKPFDVELPNGQTMSMKICQDGGKAIMSNPNKALGKWLLRNVLNVPQDKVVTYEMLLAVGVDAVSFQKRPNGSYKMDFKQVGEFERLLDKEVVADYEG